MTDSSERAEADDEQAEVAASNAPEPTPETPAEESAGPVDDTDDPDDDPEGTTPPARGPAMALNLFAGINTAELFGGANLIPEMRRSMFPDFNVWQRSWLPDIEDIQRSLRPAMPGADALSAVVGNAAFDAIKAVPGSGITGLIESMQAQQALMLKDLVPTFNARDYLAPTLQTLSRFSDILASSAIQEIAARPLASVNALLDVLPSQTMLADILATAGLTKSLDLSSILTNAFGFSTMSTAAAAAAVAQQAAAAADDDEDMEEAAVQAVLHAIDDELDPNAQPTPEQTTALRALAHLIVALRPNFRDDPQVARWIIGISSGSTLTALVYLALAHPAILAIFFLVTGIAGSTRWVYDNSTRLFLPPSEDDEDNAAE